MTDLDYHRNQLLGRRAALGERLTGIERDLDAAASADWADRATEREGDEVLETLGQAGQYEARLIGAALERIASGRYGYCVTCNDHISEARLNLLPATPFCSSCAPG